MIRPAVRWTRRRLLGSAAATVCVGCTVGPDDLSGDGDVSDTVSGIVPDTVLADGVVAGRLDDLIVEVAADGAVYVPEARAWLTRVRDGDAEAMIATHDEALHAGLRAGLIALFQKCPHLGCRVPFCESSGWFECGCHGTRFTALGEHRAGPGERGMDAFPIAIAGDTVSIRRDAIVRGQPAGGEIIDQPANGPHCVGESEH